MDWRGSKAQIEAIETAIRATGCYSIAKDKPESIEIFGERLELRSFTRILEVYPSRLVKDTLKGHKINNWIGMLEFMSNAVQGFDMEDLPVQYISFHYDERDEFEEANRLNTVRMTVEVADMVCGIVPELPGLMCGLKRWDRNDKAWQPFPKLAAQEG